MLQGEGKNSVVGNYTNYCIGGVNVLFCLNNLRVQTS